MDRYETYRDRELAERRKDRRAAYALAASTFLGPALGALVNWLLGLL